jgi:hypothetical protein
VNPSGSTATGKKIHVYTAAPSLALVSTSIATRKPALVASNTSWADAKIKFNVTALGGNIYVSSSTAGVTATTTNTASISTTISSTYNTNAETDSNWLIRQGETKWFEVTSLITNASPTAGFVYMDFSDFKWGTTSADADTDNYTWDWSSIPLEYRTTAVYLEAHN